jgi:hypothetical protein
MQRLFGVAALECKKFCSLRKREVKYVFGVGS